MAVNGQSEQNLTRHQEMWQKKIKSQYQTSFEFVCIR